MITFEVVAPEYAPNGERGYFMRLVTDDFVETGWIGPVTVREDGTAYFRYTAGRSPWSRKIELLPGQTNRQWVTENVGMVFGLPASTLLKG